MCTPGGLLDQLRRDGISVVALAFVDDAVRRELADPSHRARRGELEAMAVGARPHSAAVPYRCPEARGSACIGGA